MTWLGVLGKGLFSGGIIVTASELAKKSAIFGAMVVSLPLSSIMTFILLYRDEGDVDKVADLAEGIAWLLIPSMTLLIVLPQLLRRGWGFESAMAIAILSTIIAYGIGYQIATNFGGLSS